MELNSQIARMASFTMLMFILASLQPLVYSHTEFGVTFGESCGTDIKCDQSALLSCINNSCNCTNPNEMRFDKDVKRCLVISGGKCDLSNPKQDKLDCVKNAFCNTTGYCECTNDKDEQYIGNGEGNCVPKPVGGEKCTSDIGCREDFLLSCQDGICACNSSIGIVDPITKKCALPAGASCNSHQQSNCVSNSVCGYYAIQEERCFCEQSNGPGYVKSKTGLCLLSHEARCQGDMPCHEEFVCFNGICRCPFSPHQYFNSSIGRCVSYVGGPCLGNLRGIPYAYPCAKNAECNYDVGGGEMECSCKGEWIQSEKRSCRLAHGQSCSNEFSRGDQDCDSAGGLACRNEKCACPELQFYDEGQFKCRGLVGAICFPEQEGFCTDHAYCKKFRGNRDGLCRCIAPFTSTKGDRKCYF